MTEQTLTGQLRVIADASKSCRSIYLAGAVRERIRRTMEKLRRVDPESLYACHCTGRKAFNRLKWAFEDRCRRPRTGDMMKL